MFVGIFASTGHRQLRSPNNQSPILSRYQVRRQTDLLFFFCEPNIIQCVHDLTSNVSKVQPSHLVSTKVILNDLDRLYVRENVKGRTLFRATKLITNCQYHLWLCIPVEALVPTRFIDSRSHWRRKRRRKVGIPKCQIAWEQPVHWRCSWTFRVSERLNNLGCKP